MRYDSRPRFLQPLPGDRITGGAFSQLEAGATPEALVMIARIRRWSLATLAILAAVVAATPLAAQQTTSATPAAQPAVDAAAPQPALAGPTVERAAVGARSLPQRTATLEEAEAALQQRLGLGQARALMIVGFATVVIGLLIGDDVGTLIAIGGAAVGLYGLYHYLK
jgi:hypothetical protein